MASTATRALRAGSCGGHGDCRLTPLHRWALLSDHDVRHEFCFDGNGQLAVIYVRSYAEPTERTNAAVAVARHQVQQFALRVGSPQALVSNWQAVVALMKVNAGLVDTMLDNFELEAKRRGMVKGGGGGGSAKKSESG